jgi:hypothetical protein
MTEIVPLNIDNLPERLSFIETNRLYSVRNNLINSSRMGSFNWLPAKWLPLLDSKYDEAADHISDVYIGATKNTVQLGAAIAKANMYREANLPREEVMALVKARRNYSGDSKPKNPIAIMLDKTLKQAWHRLAEEKLK